MAIPLPLLCNLCFDSQDTTAYVCGGVYTVNTGAGHTSRAHSMRTDDMQFAMCIHSLPNQAICNRVHSAEKFKEWITNGKNATKERQILEQMKEGVCMCCVCTSYVCTYACVCL